MSLIKWNRNKELFPGFANLTSWVDDLIGHGDFESVFDKVSRMGTTVPAVNIEDTKEGYKLEMAVPGVKKEDLKIDLKGKLLTVSAENKTEAESKDKDYVRREFSFHSFSRSFTLPDNVDGSKIAASYKEGVLHLLMPKQDSKPEAGGTHIQIN